LRQSEKNYKRIVIKIGSSLFYRGEKLELKRFFEIISHISKLIKTEGKEVVIVSSGAIALGMSLMKLKVKPREVSALQAAAAIGQNALMDNYSGYFKRHGIICAQILLTWDDFDTRKRYLNAKGTLEALLKLGSVPIVNENDTVSVDEVKFGDNDRLSALVAGLVSADLLVILSDVDGLLDKDKKTTVRVVDEITPQIKSLACPTLRGTCVGGMITKIDAARIAMNSGIPCVIANGCTKNIISSVIKEPSKNGTLFVPKKGLAERERWIAFGTKSKGKITVDDGARKALLNKKSLLSVGVIAVAGDFAEGDIISVADAQDFEFARGKVGISAKQLESVLGRRSDREVIHRDNIVII